VPFTAVPAAGSHAIVFTLTVPVAAVLSGYPNGRGAIVAFSPGGNGWRPAIRACTGPARRPRLVIDNGIGGTGDCPTPHCAIEGFSA